MKNLNIRNISLKDYFSVENLIRETFWNVYKSGCEEHLVAHNMRNLPCYIKPLDLVAEIDGTIIGNIMYSKCYIVDGENYKEFVTFGPLGVLPKYQSMGVGSALIEKSFEIAKTMNIKAIFITGNPSYYNRFGFVSASKYNIHLNGVPIDDVADFFMVKLLEDNALKKVKGICKIDDCYYVNQKELENFDKLFPPKVKQKLDTQIM